MPNQNNNLSKEIYQQAKANFDWLGENAKPAELSISYDLSERNRIKFDGATEISDNDILDRIAACREAYTNVGIVGNAIDLMTDFALEGMSIVHENKAIQRFYWNWANRVALGPLSEQILKCYFRDGNVPVLSYKGKIRKKETDRFKKAFADKNRADAIKKHFTDEKIEKGFIPYYYQVLDVLNLRKTGSEFLGNSVFEYKLPVDDWEVIKKDPSIMNKREKELLSQMKETLGSEVFEHLRKTGRILIDPNRISMLYYKKDSYKKWANPMLWRVIDDLKFKSLLRDMDISVSESVINTITIIALGDTANGFAPTKEMYAKMADLLKTPSKSQTIVWNDLIKIIADYPPVEKILGKEKYEQVDGDIRSGLGIAEVLINGEGGNYSNSFLSVRTLLERLQGGRNTLLEFLTEEFRKVSVAMGFKKPAWIKLHHMNLTDQQTEKQMLLELADRGMVSYQTVIERFGENFDIEVQRMKDEDTFRRKNEDKFPYVLIKTGKFGPTLSNGPVSIEGIPTSDATSQTNINKDKNPTSQEDKGKQGGRPKNVKKKQKEKEGPRKEPKGQSQASCPNINKIDKIKISEKSFDNAMAIYDFLHEKLTKSALKNRDKLTKAQEDKIDSIIVSIIGKFDSVESITKESLNKWVKASVDQATAPEKLDRCVDRVTKKLVKDYKEEHGKAPSKEKRKELVSSAYAICKDSMK